MKTINVSLSNKDHELVMKALKRKGLSDIKELLKAVAEEEIRTFKHHPKEDTPWNSWIEVEYRGYEGEFKYCGEGNSYTAFLCPKHSDCLMNLGFFRWGEAVSTFMSVVDDILDNNKKV